MRCFIYCVEWQTLFASRIDGMYTYFAIFHVRSHALNGDTRGRFFMESSLHRFERESGRAESGRDACNPVSGKPTPETAYTLVKSHHDDVARLARERFSSRLNISIQRFARVHDSSRLFRTTSSSFHGSSRLFSFPRYKKKKKKRKNSRSLFDYRSFTRRSVVHLPYFTWIFFIWRAFIKKTKKKTVYSTNLVVSCDKKKEEEKMVDIDLSFYYFFFF